MLKRCIAPPIYPSPDVMIGDLGLVEIADPHVRLQKKLRLGVDNIHVCTSKLQASRRLVREPALPGIFGHVVFRVRVRGDILAPDTHRPSCNS